VSAEQTRAIDRMERCARVLARSDVALGSPARDDAGSERKSESTV
jgi:hypothetical protein